MSTPDLIFPHTWQQSGFTSNVTSRQAGEPDPVIRELLQNGLDAAIREAGRDRAEVHFTIAERSLELLPGLDSYRTAFQAAKPKDSKKTTNDVRSAVGRIETALGQTTMSVLFCRDNGVGLDEDRMKALLSEGQSDKAAEGAGSYGLGHLTAYAASNLRYVCYAGICEGRQIASGHAILASHKRDNSTRSSHGYWKAPPDMFQTGTDRFSLENFPREIPELLHGEIDKISDSGSVVAILGFNRFHDEKRDQAAKDICRVAAMNFMGAIHAGALVVHVHDEQASTSQTIDAASMSEFLEPKQQRTAEGWLPGEQGYRALLTLQKGQELRQQVDRSIQVRFRPLGAQATERSRVQIFRDGMWITNKAPRLDTGAFGGVRPFDAVVSLSDADPDDHTEFYDLVRNAEGPEHRGLSKLREMPKQDRNTLTGKLEELADRLREEAGEVGDSGGFTPAGFAIFSQGDAREAEKAPRLRHRLMAAEDDESQISTDPTGDETDEFQEPDHPGHFENRDRIRPARPGRAPAKGTAVPLQRSLVPVVGANGSAKRLRAMLKGGDDSSGSGKFGLRIYIESGSDETCEQPLAPLWQPIRSVTINGEVIDAGGKLEVIIPASSGDMEIELDEPVDASAQLELEIVRRRGKDSQS